MHLSSMLSESQVATIHRTALRVLAEVGVRVEHAGVRALLQAAGGTVAEERVRFASRLVEDRIAAARKTPVAAASPTVRAFGGIYQSSYLDPECEAPAPFNEARLAAYLGFARQLPDLAYVQLLGLPFTPDGISPHQQPLAEKLYAWKYGTLPCGTVQYTDLCAPLLDLFACHAAYSGKTLADVFTAGGYLISPLRLALPECEQLLFFRERGLPMAIGHLPTQGGTAPVTFAGALALALAEQLFLHLLHYACHGETELALSASVATLDMRDGAPCYGRPEQQRINAAFAEIARLYGCACSGHTGLTDARQPSHEAGAQKATGALFTALATGHGRIEAGLLGMDEICSPVQMLLDIDLANSLQALLAEAEVTEETAAFAEIAAHSDRGSFLDSAFTAEHFRRELFRPATWSTLLRPQPDVERAREMACETLRAAPRPLISEEEERALRRIIAGAAQAG